MGVNSEQHCLTQKTRPEMHREVRATTNFSQEFEFKARVEGRLGRKVEETALGIRPSSSSRKKNGTLKCA
jgi:hypothetical protein